MRPLRVNAFRLAIASGVAATALLGGAAPALGATTIGSNFDGNLDCDGPATYFQQGTAPASPSYTVPPGGGVITSWSAQQGAGLAGLVKFGVFRPTGPVGKYTTTGSSGAEALDTAGVETFQTRLPAQAGDTIGVLIVSGTYDCARNGFDPADIGQRDASALHDAGNTFTYSDANNEARINVSASVEPDADADGYGDETQDSCPDDPAKQDCVSPQTTITKEPKNKSAKHKAKYKFTSDEPDSSFECKIDKKPYKPCDSPKKFKVDDGKHKFKVRAIDANGNVDPSPDKDKFKVV